MLLLRSGGVKNEKSLCMCNIICKFALKIEYDITKTFRFDFLHDGDKHNLYKSKQQEMSYRGLTHRLLALLALTSLCTLQVWSRSALPADTVSVQKTYQVRTTQCVIHPLYFHFDDDAIDLSYMGNETVIKSFRHLIDSVGISNVDSIRIVVQSSPEGSATYNYDLSRRRAINTERYLNQYHPDIMPVTRVIADGESWGALRQYIITDNTLSANDINRLLKIIDDTSDLWLRKQKLQATGELYQYLYRTYYKSLRNSIIATVFTTNNALDALEGMTAGTYVPQTSQRGYVTDRGGIVYQGVARPDTIFLCDTVYVHRTVIVDSIYVHGVKPGPEEVIPFANDTIRRDAMFALKTNLLFDLVTALNGELEIPIGRRHSVVAEVVWPWWLQKSHNHWCFEMGSGSLEYRYWLRSWTRHKTYAEYMQSQRQPLRGIFFGVYAGGGYYDLQWKRNDGYQGEFLTAGLTFGYSRYVSRFVRLEFSLGAGYVKNKYRTYYINNNTPVNPDADQHLIRDGRHRNNWIGPTKAKVSLSLLLHRKCHKKKEGGEL